MKDDIDNLVYRIPAYQEIDMLVERLRMSMNMFEGNSVNRIPLPEANKAKSHSQAQSEFTAAVAIFNQVILLSCGIVFVYYTVLVFISG